MNLKPLNNLNLKQKFVFSMVVFVVSVLLITTLMIVRPINHIKELKGKIIDQEIEKEKRTNKQSDINIQLKKLNQVEPQLEKLNEIFINRNRELEFITQLEAIADNNNIEQVFNLTPPDSKTGNNAYVQSRLTLDLKGNFIDLMKYLTELEALSYYITINSLDISVKNEVFSSRSRQSEDDAPVNPAISTIHMKITANTYWK